LTLKIQLKNIEIELLNLWGISSKAEIKKMQEDLSGHALQKLLPLMNFLVLSGETGENLILSFSTPPNRSHLDDYLNCLLLGQVLQMKILMVLPAWVH
jgi:hypothetical protein